jgi:hypothetical protein
MMFTKVSIHILMSSFFMGLLNPPIYSNEYREQYARKLNSEIETRFVEKLKTLSPTTALSLVNASGKYELARTWYDYAPNNGRTITHAYDYGSDGIHFVFSKILPQGADRYVNYGYWSDSLGIFIGPWPVDESIGLSGLGRVVNGNEDEAIIALHALPGAYLYVDDCEACFNFLQAGLISDAIFSQIAHENDVIVSMATIAPGLNWRDTILVTIDYMQTWTGHGAIPQDTLTNFVEFGGLSINAANPDEFSYLYAPDVTATAPHGSIRLATTPDLGATYTSIEIHDDDDVNPNGRMYIIENFSQMNGMYTTDGNYHAVFGAVQGILDTTTSTQIDGFPILYWNSADDTLVELSDQEHSWPANTTTQTNLANLRPGNGLGNAYPHISEGPNGELVCIWQQWEDDGAGGLVTQVGTGGSEIFMTNIWGAYSPDGGTTWGSPFFVAGTDGESDVYPQITERFVYNAAGDSIYLDIMYMLDTDPGTSLFAGGNNPSECVWYYERVAISQIIGSIADQKASAADRFTLFQNFPNPFNSETRIQYELPQASKITLEIFDISGRKIAILIDSRRSAGIHEVPFEATHLASGIYLYRLTAGKYVQTKKMVLLR